MNQKNNDGANTNQTNNDGVNTNVLDNLKRERTNLRRQFTTACNQFDELIADTTIESKQISVIFNKILDKSERLFKIDSELSELLELNDDEYDQIESYRDRFIEIKTIYEKNEQSSHDEVSSTNSISGLNLKLPKLNLKEYDLVPRTWVAFWGQFSRIHVDDSIREEDKFQYLLSSLKSKTKARDIVESYPPSKDNYIKVIEHLKSRFGRTDLLIEVYVRDLLALVSNRSSVKLSELYDKLGSYLRGLETLGVTTQNYAAMLYPVVESCLPAEVLKAWDRYRLNRETNVEDSLTLTKEKLLENLMSFLQHEVEGEEHRVLAESAFGNAMKNKKEHNSPISRNEPTASALINSSPPNKKLNCIFCDYNHSSQNCNRAATLSNEERKSIVIKKKCCLVCLKPNHLAKNCRSNVKCIVCSRRHYPLLCPDLKTKSTDMPSNQNRIEGESSATLFASSLHEIYLKTLIVRLRHKNKCLNVRALLDDGSHRSYIEKSLVQELKLTPVGTETLCQGLFGGSTTPLKEHGRFNVVIESTDGKYSTKLSFLDQSKICSNLPRIKDKNLISQLSSKGIRLSDVGNDIPPIRLLIGADIIGSLLTGRIEVLKGGLSVVETKLGWTVLGLGRKREVLNTVSLCLQSVELEKLWDLETLGINDPIQEKARKILDEETLLHFTETVKINEKNRYEISLPWLAGHPQLFNNYDKAALRLMQTTKRLLKENYFEEYNDIFLRWESEGIIEEVEPAQTTEALYYLPHRPVIKLSSVTTKIRPVFDASSKTSGGASLNDCLSTGPSLIQQIPLLLNKFRIDALGVTADIKQAFLQISVRPEDRNVLRFLWWKDKDRSAIKEYRHTRVVFGVTSSPFLLNATIDYHLQYQQFQTIELQTTMEILKKGFYVDNLITSVQNEDEYMKLQVQSKEVMKIGGFDLRCWTCTGDENQEDHSVLGLKWNTESDELKCHFPKAIENLEDVGTKRKLLSIVNSVYDPIGFTLPAMLFPKLLLQEAWKRKISWDEPLPNDLQSQYKNWVKHFHCIQQCSIPRRMFYGSKEDATLHLFSDASGNAYACCAYLRCKENSEVFVNLVSAKSRVSPINRPTIPRLELLGALLAARLAKTIKSAMNFPLKTFFWTDSMVALAWILKKEPWNNFVGNRVKEIRELTDTESWRYVPGDQNPADLPSRSCTCKELEKKNWWEGPSWLKNSTELWPNECITFPEEALTERRKVVISAANIQDAENFSQRLLYFSEYPKLLRMMAWILRFCRLSKNKEMNISINLRTEEINEAEVVLTKIIQREWCTENRKRYEGTMKFYEENGLLKVKTRLILGEDNDDFKYPIVLPDHLIVRRYIEYIHKSLNHAGVQTVLSHIRERFWIPRGRRVIREVISRCIPCKRHSVKAIVTEPAPLPANRINRVAVFQVTGTDLAGPIFLREGIKAWIVLFTCAVFRAVHLELISSLSTEAFMQALRRFFARRGRISIMYTDNGTNFVGTSRCFENLDWEAIQAECGMRKIKWNFIPPSAPWYGGWWERIIRLIKDLLKRNLGKACLSFEEMQTVLCDCEDTINKRPLTYVCEDPNEPLPLTPAHFLHDVRNPLELNTIDLYIIDGNHLRKRLRYVQRVREHFRRRFQREYISELVRNPDVKRLKDKIQIGDIVLVGSENLKRINWPLGKVIELFVGKDGKQRVARLKVAKGEIIRPLQRLYPLEISSKDIIMPTKNEESLPEVAEQPKCAIDSDKMADEIKFSRKGRPIVKPKKLDL